MLMLLMTILIILIYSGSQIKEKVNVISIFALMWLIIVGLCSLHLMNMIPYNGDKVYFIVLMGVAAFSIGYLILRIGNIPVITLRHKSSKNFVLNNRITIFVLTLIFLFLAFKSVKIFRLLSSGVSLSSIRYDYFIKGKILSPVENIIFVWLVTPIVNYCLIPINMINYINKEGKYRKSILILSILNAGLKILITQGKENLIIYILSLYISIKQFGEKRQIKRKIFWIIIIITLMIFLLAMVRSKDVNWLFFYGYIGIQMSLLDHWTSYIDSLGMHTYGLAFILGFINIPISLMEFVGISFPGYDRIVDLINYINAEGITVFPPNICATNVYTTCFTYFYLDFGMAGVVLESLIFGIIIGYLSKLYDIKKKDGFYITLYNIVIVSVLCTFITWEYYTTVMCLALILSRLFFKRAFKWRKV